MTRPSPLQCGAICMRRSDCDTFSVPVVGDSCKIGLLGHGHEEGGAIAIKKYNTYFFRREENAMGK